MRRDEMSAERLERQRALIDTVRARIERRASRGENVNLSMSLLRQEERLYRSMLGKAPLSVLEEHESSACST